MTSRRCVLAALICLGLAGGGAPANAMLQDEPTSGARDLDMLLTSGRRQPSLQGRLVILAVFRQEALIVARRGESAVRQPASVTVPAGTELVIASVSGWDLGFGTPVLVQEDRYFGLGHVDVEVESYSRLHPDRTRTARIGIRARLSDVNGDDRWWARVRYQLIALGRER